MIWVDAPPCRSCGAVAIKHQTDVPGTHWICPLCNVVWAQEPAQIDTAKASVQQGRKDDKDKPRWDLLPFPELGQIVNVLTFGAKKYAPENWKKVPHARDRYFRAAVSHLALWRGGEKHDPETGLSHLAHAGCNILFLLWFDEKELE